MFQYYRIIVKNRVDGSEAEIIISSLFQLMFFKGIKKGQETIAMANATINFFSALSETNDHIQVLDFYKEPNEFNENN